MFRKQLAPLLLLLTAPATAQGILSQYGEIVQRDGDAVAALPGAHLIPNADPFVRPSIDLDGDMVWRVSMQGGPVTGPTTSQAILFGRTGGDIELVLQSGSPEPSGTLPGVTCNGASTGGLGGVINLSATGEHLMFGSLLSGAGIVQSGTTAAGRNDSALFVGQRGNLHLFAQRGGAAPSGGAQIDSSFEGWSGSQFVGLNSSGTAIARVHLVGGDAVAGQNDDAWLVDTGGSVQWLCREGDPLLGGAVVVSVVLFNAQIDESGNVLLAAFLSTTLGANPATSADDKVLLLCAPGGGRSIVFREGDPVPGQPGVFFGEPQLASGAFTRQGQRMIFAADLTGAVTPADDRCYVAGTPGNLAVVAREGDPAPTGVTGDFFSALYLNSARINEAGVMCFLADVQNAVTPTTAATDTCLFCGTPGHLALVARDGDPAPGMPAGHILGTENANGPIGGLAEFSLAPHLNEQGMVLFGSHVWDGVYPTSICDCQFAYDRVHGLRPAILEGESWPSGIAASFRFADGNSGDGGPLFFNDNGDYCCTLSVRTPVVYPDRFYLVRGHVGTLQGSTAAIPATGGTQSFALDATAAHAGKLYLVAGNMSGTRPGFAIRTVHVPLNLDFWFNISVQAANSTAYATSFGTLDAGGRASAAFAFPPGFPGFAGATYHHAFAVLDPVTGSLDHVSEPVALRLH